MDLDLTLNLRKRAQNCAEKSVYQLTSTYKAREANIASFKIVD